MEEGGSRIRAFVALEIPAHWQRAMGELQRELQAELRGPGYRWVRPEQMHLTLRFLGSIFASEVRAVSESLAAVAASTACLRLNVAGLGCFPELRRARVLWAGLNGDLEGLSRLHHAINRATGSTGEPPDDRPFRPHLTLARIKETAAADFRRLAGVLDRPFSLEAWTAESVCLMRSQLGPDGASHEVLSDHSFASAEPSPFLG